MRTAPLVLLLALAACRRDGASPEGAAKLNAPPPVHLVARVREEARLHVLADGTPVMDAGLFLYELRSAGAPVLIGDLASYGPLRAPGAARLGPEAPSDVDVPSRYKGVEWVRLANETWLALAMDVEERGETALVAKPPSRDVEPVPFEANIHDCGIVPSADGRAYVACQSPTTRLLRLEGSKWTDIPVQRMARWIGPGRASQPARVAVGPDGTVWYEDADDPLRIRRYLPGGHHDDLELPHLTMSWPASIRADGIERAVDAKPGRLRQLLPLRTEMWAVVEGERGETLVYRLGGSAPPGSAYVGSLDDQRAAVANAVGPAPATGHCAPVFVPLVVARGASFPIDRLAARSAIVDEAKNRGGRVVIGWHGERRAAGVFFAHEDEAIIAELVEAFSDDPTSPPRPSCTPPVVERTID